MILAYADGRVLRQGALSIALVQEGLGAVVVAPESESSSDVLQRAAYPAHLLPASNKLTVVENVQPRFEDVAAYQRRHDLLWEVELCF